MDYREELEIAAREAVLERGLSYDLDSLSGMSDLRLKGILEEFPGVHGIVAHDDGWWDLPPGRVVGVNDSEGDAVEE